MAQRSPEPQVLTLGHSPDPDDAFMWWPLGDEGSRLAPAIDTGRFRFRIVALDIESLNRRAEEVGDLDITALSIHAYPGVKGRYTLTSCGGSFGDGYGPKVVARPEVQAAAMARESAGTSPGWLCEPGVRVAIPGRRTTAFLALSLCLGRRFTAVEMPFDRIVGAVAQGEVEAGLVIHEGQLTFEDAGLELVMDLGVWWRDRTGLPLPLGGNAVRRDLDLRYGPGAIGEVVSTLARSIGHALARRGEGVDRAMGFARGVSRDRVDQFIGMYVNALTLDAGPAGGEAIRVLLGRGAACGLCADPRPVELAAPAGAPAGRGQEIVQENTCMGGLEGR